MTDISLKLNWVYLNRSGDRVHITDALMRDGDPNPVSFNDSTGIGYNPDGSVIQYPYENDLVEELFECHGLDTAHRINFYEQDYYVFSSFSSFSIRWKGIRFDTLEAAYHYEKFDAYGYRDKDNTDFKELAVIRGMIRTANSAHDAFKVAQLYKDKRRPDWDEKEVKVRTMFMLVIEKVKQHEYVRTKLLNTHDRRLSENSWRDSFWGSGPDDTGFDVLGQIWMLVRSILKYDLLSSINPRTHPLDSIVCEYETKETEKQVQDLVSTPAALDMEDSVYTVIGDGSQLDPSNFIERYTDQDLVRTLPESGIIKAPLPKGMVDTPELRQKLHEFIIALSDPSTTEDDILIRQLEGRARFLRDRGEVKSPELLEKAAIEFRSNIASQNRASFVDVGRMPIGNERSS